jgi:glucose-6-phosphate 1-dehydrogenase
MFILSVRIADFSSQVRVLRAMDPIEPKNVIIGQYVGSSDGSKPAYLDDNTVPKGSRCPTFCALVAYIKNERWDGVPWIIKAGKGRTERLVLAVCKLTGSPSAQ